MHRNHAAVTCVTPRRGRQVRVGLLAPAGPGLKRDVHQRRSDAERRLARRDAVPIAVAINRSHSPARGCAMLDRSRAAPARKARGAVPVLARGLGALRDELPPSHATMRRSNVRARETQMQAVVPERSGESLHSRKSRQSAQPTQLSRLSELGSHFRVWAFQQR